MTDTTTPIATLIDRAEDYGNTTIELLKLKAIDKTADVVSSLVSRVVILMVVALSIVITSIGLALWIGSCFGNSFPGFFIVGGIYTTIAILLYCFRYRWLKTPISNTIIKQTLKPQKG